VPLLRKAPKAEVRTDWILLLAFIFVIWVIAVILVVALISLLT
jgi:hypothetical protein